MRVVRFFKIPFIVALIGLFPWLEGRLFKIRHWPYPDELLTTGFYIVAVAIVIAIVKIALLKKSDDNK